MNLPRIKLKDITITIFPKLLKDPPDFLYVHIFYFLEKNSKPFVCAAATCSKMDAWFFSCEKDFLTFIQDVKKIYIVGGVIVWQRLFGLETNHNVLNVEYVWNDFQEQEIYRKEEITFQMIFDTCFEACSLLDCNTRS